MVEQGTENPRVIGSIPIGGTTALPNVFLKRSIKDKADVKNLEIYADLAHLVERDLAKVEVAGSSPVIRSKTAHAVKQIRRHSQVVRQRSAKPLCPGSNPGGASKTLLLKIKYASVAQLVEQGTENPRVIGSIPIGGTT